MAWRLRDNKRWLTACVTPDRVPLTFDLLHGITANLDRSRSTRYCARNGRCALIIHRSFADVGREDHFRPSGSLRFEAGQSF